MPRWQTPLLRSPWPSIVYQKFTFSLPPVYLDPFNWKQEQQQEHTMALRFRLFAISIFLCSAAAYPQMRLSPEQAVEQAIQNNLMLETPFGSLINKGVVQWNEMPQIDSDKNFNNIAAASGFKCFFAQWTMGCTCIQKLGGGPCTGINRQRRNPAK